MVSSGARQTGSAMTPLAERFTLVTSLVCSSIERFLWMMPMPPSWAKAMARFASVTVSIGEETIGILSGIWQENRVWVLVSAGIISDFWGTKRMSSKVMPSLINLLSMNTI